MNLSRYKWCRPSLHRVVAKQQSKREQAHPVCLQELQKSKMFKSINTQNDYERTSKK